MIQPFKINGVTLYVDPSDPAVGHAFYSKVPPEPHVDANLLPLFKPGKVFLDIGANIGFYSLRAAKAGCRVISIEPNQIALECLLAGIKANNFSIENVDLFPSAVGKERGVAWLHGNCTNAEVDTGWKLSENGRQVVRVDTVANILKVCQATPDIIKIDIEGSEPLALDGMPPELFNGKRPIIFTEFYPRLIERLNSHSAISYLNALVDRGYSKFNVLDKFNPGIIECKTPSEVMEVFMGSVTRETFEIAYLDLMIK